MKQEEGWVVCRAFKKLSPNHKQQGFEHWNNSYFAGARSDNNHIYRPPSFPAINNLDHLINHGSTTNHYPPFQSDGSCSQIFDLPKLDSPSMSTSFTTNDNNVEEAEDETRNNVGYDQQHSVWRSFDKLLDCQEMEPSSFSYTNMPLAPHINDELDAHAHITHVLECFHDL